MLNKSNTNNQNVWFQEQSVQTQTMIKDHFRQLHEVLHQEESKRIASVKREEETRIMGMKEKIKELSAEVQTLKESISVLQGQLKEDDMLLLKVCIMETSNRNDTFLITKHALFHFIYRISKMLETGRSKSLNDTCWNNIPRVKDLISTEEKALRSVLMTCPVYCSM